MKSTPRISLLISRAEALSPMVVCGSEPDTGVLVICSNTVTAGPVRSPGITLRGMFWEWDEGWA